MRPIIIVQILLIILITITACEQPNIKTVNAPSPNISTLPNNGNISPVSASDIPLQIVSLTTPVNPGDLATMVVQTIPLASCSISVQHGSINNFDAGLKPKTSDNNGMVSWTWKTGTVPGYWDVEIRVINGSKSYSTSTLLEILESLPKY